MKLSTTHLEVASAVTQKSLAIIQFLGLVFS